MSFPYTPGTLPESLPDLVRFLEEELWRLKRALVAGDVLPLENIWVEPQTFSGYTVLGDGPAIKTKKLTGTTAALQGGQTLVAHGLVSTKILSVEVLVTSTPNRIPPEHTFNATLQYSVYLSGTNVVVENSAANSAGILSKAFTVLLTYEE
jgi:hypothetical protein